MRFLRKRRVLLAVSVAVWGPVQSGSHAEAAPQTLLYAPRRTAAAPDSSIRSASILTIAASAGGSLLARASEDTLTSLRQFEEQTFAQPLPKTPGVVLHRRAPDTRPPPPSFRPVHPPPWLAEAMQRKGRPSATGRSADVGGLRLPDLPVHWDEKLIRYLEYYRKDPRGRAIMTVWLRRMGRYQRMIQHQLRQQKLPQALIYVAMIESGFDPLRTSSAGAVGLWQFMLHTARAYGLLRDHWIDERRNPERSTAAALRLLSSLEQRLGSWELALAAYHAGFGGVVEAVQKYNTNDYWRLCRYEAGLPWSTTLYVPKVLAVAIVDLNRKAFGFVDVGSDPELRFDVAHVNVSVTTEQLARAAGVDVAVMRQLNPELRRGRTPGRAAIWVRIPPGSTERFYAGLATTRHRESVVRPHVVRLGEGLESIAERFGTSVRQIRRLNRLDPTGEVRPGVTLFVPAVPDRRSARGPKRAPEQPEPILAPLAAESPTTPAGKRRVFYRTVLGDSLAEIARALHTTPEKLARWNALAPHARLVSKMVLQAFVDPAFQSDQIVLLDTERVVVVAAGSEPFLDEHERRKGRTRLIYTVRTGDSLARIARRFGLSVGSILRINQFGRDTPLVPGDKIVLYVKPPSKQKRRRTAPRS